MKYLIVDACLSGTGIRDKYEGGYISTEDLKLSPALLSKISQWLTKYQNEHYNGFINIDIIDTLDIEGIEIAGKIKNELLDVKIEYFSAARMTSKII
jgi:hypothetical protein